MKVVALEGDGIGPEVTAAALEVLEATAAAFDVALHIDVQPFGGSAIDRYGSALPVQTANAASAADAVLLGAAGGPQWDDLPREQRPEASLLRLRKASNAYANLRPSRCVAGLERYSALRADAVRGADVLIVRELAGGLYYCEPRGRSEDKAWNTMRYSTHEVARVARIAFDCARRRRKRLLNVDKANVLECSAFFRSVVAGVAREFPDVELEHAYVDAAALRLVSRPASIDVLLTENMFGDILSDVAAALPGSIGVLPSASLGGRPSIFEPVHGSAPDIAGAGIANPVGAMLSAAMLLEHAANRPDAARRLESAVYASLKREPTRDLGGTATTAAFTRAVKEALLADRQPGERFGQH